MAGTVFHFARMRWRMALLPGSIGVLLALFLVAPGSLMAKFHGAMTGLCAQRPDHSIFIGGVQLPLEARMGGIFAGYLMGMVYLFILGRAQAGLLPSGDVLWTLLGFVAIMGLDGLNAVAHDLGGGLYQPSLGLRLATGLLAGYALVALSWPVVDFVLWKDWQRIRSLESRKELLGGLVLLGVFYLLTTSGLPILLYPVSMFMVAGVLASFTYANTYVLALVTGRRRRYRTWEECTGLLLAGLFLTVVELAALGLLRTYMEAELDVRWVV